MPVRAVTFEGLDDEMIRVVDALSEAVVVGVVTQNDVIGEDAPVDFRLVADQIGIAISDPRIFEMAAAAAGCRARHLVHVGREVETARRAGCRVVLVGRSGEADAVIDTLDRLPEVLAAWDREEVEGVGVGPHPQPWPDDARLDPALLTEGDRRNVADRYRYWRREAIVADLDHSRHLFHVAIENWRHDLNIGTVVRTANAFNAAGVHIVGLRRWNRRGAMVTDRYQHVHYHETVGVLLGWARDLPVVAIDNLPGAEPLETASLPERVVLLFGQEGSGLSVEARSGARRVLSIAQFGSTRSINAGVAAGIAMHTWVRQHRADPRLGYALP